LTGRRRCPGPIVGKNNAAGHPSNRRFPDRVRCIQVRSFLRR
jgi:hypothetical protein